MDHTPFILIIDDENDFPDIIGAKLNAAHIETTHVKKPKQAVEEALKRKPDLVLMDINMPEVQGPELLLDFKQNETLKDVPITFLTNSKDPWPGITGNQLDVAKELGAVDFLQKTEDLDVLLKKIQDILGGKTQTPGPQAPEAKAANAPETPSK